MSNFAGLSGELADLADIADCTVGDQTRGETLQGVAEDVLAQAPDRFALAGFSLGGFVAQQILRIAPDKQADPEGHADWLQALQIAQRDAQMGRAANEPTRVQ